jgi:hypothetical protein
MLVHQAGPGPGLLLGPRHILTSVYVLAHDGDVPFVRVVPTSLADGYLRHGGRDCGEFGRLPRLLREAGMRGRSTAVDVPPGHAFHCDPRTLCQYGSSAFRVMLVLRWVTPLGVVRRPVGARRSGGSAVSSFTGTSPQRSNVPDPRHLADTITLPCPELADDDTSADRRGVAVFTRRGDHTATGWLSTYRSTTI